MYNIDVKVVRIKGKKGYDVIVKNGNATVQDYLDGLNRAIEELPFDRLRAPSRSSCAGCDLCCRERAPLTLMDVLNLKKVLNIESKNLDVQEILKKAAYIIIDGPVVDIMLRRDKDDKCIFLDKKSSLCKIYAYRPLVCQLYICTPATYRAKWLWEVVVNEGEDELVRKWLIQMKNKKLFFDEGNNPCPDIRDWQPTPFANKTRYCDVFLKDICPPKLWKLLIKN